MIKLVLFFLFLYLLITYILRWFVISNSPEFLKQYGERTLLKSFSNNFRSAFYSFFLEYCSYIIVLLLLVSDYFYHYAVTFFLSDKTSTQDPASNDKPPVLLIHGYMMRGWVLLYIKKRLQNDGWNQVYTWNYIPPFKNIPYYADQLGDKVSDILTETGQSKIILIGHSMGGLLARYYISHLGGNSCAKKLITLATPHKGTKLWPFTCSPCGLEMRPGSDFLKNLKPVPARTKTLSIYSSFDEIVLPYQNCFLSGKNVENKEFDDLGHMRLIYSPKVYEEIRMFLAK